MASIQNSIFLFFLAIFVSHTESTLPVSPKPKSLNLPIAKDKTTLQYTIPISLGTPFVPKILVLDLGGRFSWINCETNYKSSTYKPSPCGSPPCLVSKAPVCVDICLPSPQPGCNNNTCNLYTENSVTKTVGTQEVTTDRALIQSKNGAKGYDSHFIIFNFIFACTRKWLLNGLAKGADGMAGLGRTNIGLPTQIVSAIGKNSSFPRKFALCLPSKPKFNGVLFFGNPSYTFFPYYNTSRSINVSERFSYTNLYKNPISTATPYIPDQPLNESSADYFIKLTSIAVERNPINIKSELLSINKQGIGGTKISTITPYTLLQSSIYLALTKAFSKQLAAEGIHKIAPVAPFTDCYNRSSERLSYTPLGPAVPTIDFVFGGQNERWEINGGNSMVEIGKDVLCLGFVDGGINPRTSVVIGAHQMENNLFEFDLESSKVGFTSTLLLEEVGCENYKV